MRPLLLSAAVAISLTGLTGCGTTLPPIPTGGPVDLPTEPAALDGWLAGKEALFTDIVPGAEKGVVWADPEEKARAPVSIVYLHGFSATRKEIDPLLQEVAAELGANLFFTRLTGHGRGNGSPLAEASVDDWVRDGYEALAIGSLLGEQTVLVGTSTGGTLAAWLAAQPASDLDALVLISPNFGPKASGSRLLLMPGRSVLTRLVLGKEREWEPHNKAQAEFWTWRYPSKALFPMMELVQLVEETDLGAIQIPSLVIYSPNDQVIDATLVEARFPEIGSAVKALYVVEESSDPSNHVLAGEIMSPEMTAPLGAETLRFLRENLSL